MPFNGAGVFSRLYSWVTDAVNGLPISPSRMDADSNDIAAGLTLCLTKNGQSTPTANLPMGGYKLTGLGTGSAASDSVNFGQLTAYTTGLVTDTVAGVRALLKTGSVLRTFVTGYYAAGDGGGGEYWYNPTDTSSADNGGTIIVANDGGRWYLVYDGVISSAQFGASSTQTAAVNNVALQNWLNAIGTNSLGTPAPEGLLAGYYPISTSLVFNYQFVKIRGTGKYTSGINYTASTVAAFKCAAITYLIPSLSDFCIVGASTSGIGIDLSQITSQVYNGYIRDLYIYAGQAAIYAPNFFSMRVESVVGSSYNDHVFKANCGPAVTWLDCYASLCATGKAGYRLTGLIHLINCNGIDAGDYWGIFGQNSAGSDGFQNDFPTITNDYPIITLTNCNIEQFAGNSTTASGILVDQSARAFTDNGCKFDRSGLATNFHSYLRFKLGMVSSIPARLNTGEVFASSGSPAQANGYIYGDASITIEDSSQAWSNIGMNGAYQVPDAAIVPNVRWSGTVDIYNDTAATVTALSPRRLSIQVARYSVPAALTPVGSAQAIVVTGYDRVIVTPAAAASISTATFDQTVGGGTDYGRNGVLIIEAGNGNLTINFSAQANGFRTALNATTGSYTFSTGQVMRFCWSITNSCWVQV